MRYFMLHKPPGCLCARIEVRNGISSVYDHVPDAYPRLPHVGRLDFNTEGLLLFSDDGRLAQALLNRRFPVDHPPIEKEYHVKVRPLLDPGDPRIAELAQPLAYPDGSSTLPATSAWLAQRRRSTWISVTLTEGRHHQVRNLCARSGLQVVKLRRVRIGPIQLGDLRMRWCRPLTEAEVASLYALALPHDERPSHEPILPPQEQIP